MSKSLAPEFSTKDFDGSGGDCWWVRLRAGAATQAEARQWCADNGVTLVVFGDKYQSVGADRSQHARWVGFVYEDDALMFYLAHV